MKIKNLDEKNKKKAYLKRRISLGFHQNQKNDKETVKGCAMNCLVKAGE